MSARARARAAVLDASYLAAGRLNVAKVQRLASELTARGAELWIPEAVVWEFAVHAWEDRTSNRQTYRRLRRAGLAPNPELSELDSAQIAGELLKVCAAIPNVTIIDVTGASAIAGLRDQILGTGSGSVEQGVRTGAADSSWVRDVLARAGNNPSALVFLSRNVKDVLATAAALNHARGGIQIWNRTGVVAEDTMLQEFFGAATAPSTAGDSIDGIRALGIISASLRQDYSEAMAADDRHGPPPAWLEVRDVSIGLNLDGGEDAEIETMIDPEAEVEPHLRLVDITVVDVYETGPEGSSASVDYIVRLLADVRVEGQKIDNDGNIYWDWLILRDRLLRVPYSAELRGDALINVRQTDEAENYSAAPRFADTFDAYEWLYNSELTTWQHITVHPLDRDADLPTAFELRGPGGRIETAELTPSADLTGDWTLEFENTGANIGATYDHTARVALGRNDSFDAFPPASLHSETRIAARYLPEPYTALAEL